MTVARLFAVILLPFLLALGPLAHPQESAGAEQPVTALTPEQAEALAALLSDDAVHEALLAELQRLAEAGGAEVDAAPAEPEPDSSPISVARGIAETTQAVAEEIVDNLSRFWRQLSRAPQTLDDALNVSPEVVLDAVRELALLFIITVVIFLGLRVFVWRFDRSMDRVAGELGSFRTGLLMGASILIDAAVVGVAWAAGYALALFAFDPAGEMSIRQTLYLNAFVTVEMVRVLVRALLSPVAPELRPVALPDAGARVLNRWLGFVVSLLGYGQLLVVPIVNQSVSWFAGRAISTILAVAAVLVLIGLVLRYRRPVATWLLGEDRGVRRGLRRGLAQLWHVFALIYLLTVLAIVLARPGDVLFSLLGASGEIAMAVIIGLMAANFLDRAISRGIQLPDGVSERLPLLEGRLNAFVPRALMVLRLVILVVIVAFAADVLGFFDVQGWLSSRLGVELTGTFLSVLLMVFFAFAVWLALSSWVDYRLTADYGGSPFSRERTLLTLLRNAANVVIMVITLMFVLSEIGIDIAPLIASAGVLGLAIGFGAQKLVQDIITGVFIQLENAMNVGDVVTVGGTSGTVERLTIRSVSLRDVQGVYHIIPFSSVDMVSNYMRDFAFHVADMGIAYREDIDEAKQAMLDAFEQLKASDTWSGGIIGDLQWFGVQSLDDSAVVLRARIKCFPGQQWGIGRAYNELLKKLFDERGIEIPFPHQTVYFGELKDGSAPPVNVRVEKPRAPETPEPTSLEKPAPVEADHPEQPEHDVPG